MKTEFPHLLSPMRIGTIEVRNRLVMSAYQTKLGAFYRPTKQLVAFHSARAAGGIGLIVVEGIRCHPSGRGTPMGLIGWDESAIPSFRRLADAIHEHGAKVIAQLLHQGRAANSMETMLPLWSASRVSVPPVWALHTSETTRAMTRDEIQEVARWWARCAVNMKRAGMDGVEVHAGHGYLLQQFLSPLTNFRRDEYGGSLKNRARFCLEVLHSVRRAVGPDFVVGIRLSADELVPGGYTIEETKQVAQWLEDSETVDYLSITHSTTEPSAHAQQIPDMSWPEAPFVHLPAAIKEATHGLPVFAVGRIIDPIVAERVIADGKADFVCMARAHIAEPEIGRKLMEGRYADVRQCIGCNQGCAGRVNAGLPVGCLINAEAGRELELGPLHRSKSKRSIAVVGGGPAGMEAARIAALRRHSVTLYERDQRLGGQITTLVRAPHRRDFGKIVHWLEAQMRSLGVTVRLGAEVTPELLEKANPDAAIVATGSVPDLPAIPGMSSAQGIRLVSADDVLERQVDFGAKAVVIDGDGHHKATSTTEYLADLGLAVHLLTRAHSVGAEITSVSRTPAVSRLLEKGVSFQTSRVVREVQGRNLIIQSPDGNTNEQIDDVDLIVAVTPNSPNAVLFEDLLADGSIPMVLAAGDCLSPRRALEAIREGHMAGRAV